MWTDFEHAICVNEEKEYGHEHSDEYGLQNPGIVEQWTDYGLVVRTTILNVARTHECYSLRGISDARASANVLLLGMCCVVLTAVYEMTISYIFTYIV